MITNVINNKSYIGSSTQFEKRLRQHRLGKQEWQKDFATNPQNYEVKIIDEADTQDRLAELELFYINKYDTINNGYNQNKNVSRVKYENQEANSLSHSKSMTKEVREKIKKKVHEYYDDPIIKAEHNRKTKEAMAKLEQKWIHKGNERHKVAKAELQSWLDDGWELGKGRTKK